VRALRKPQSDVVQSIVERDVFERDVEHARDSSSVCSVLSVVKLFTTGHTEATELTA
jgi:hypothetical protein